MNHSKEDFFLCPICKKEIVKEENVDKYITNKEVIKMVDLYFNIPEIEIKKNEGERIIKYDIVLLGKSGVGKTSIFQRLSKDIFTGLNANTNGIGITV